MIDIAGLKLEHPVMNGAGSCKTLEDVELLSRCGLSAIMVGSATVLKEEGNVGDTFYYEQGLGSINSVGLKNLGLPYYREHLPQMISIAHAAGMPLFFSGAGNTPEEFGKLAKLATDTKADVFEADFSCPNRWAKIGVSNRNICFDHRSVRVNLRAIRKHYSGRLAIKVSPYSDWFELVRAANLITDYANCVTVCNTFPQAFMFRSGTEHPAVAPQFQGLGGYGGEGLRPIALGQVVQWCKALEYHLKIAVIGVGGISTGHHVLEFLWCGASAVQVVTELIKSGRLNPSPAVRLVRMYQKESGKWNLTKTSNAV